MKPLYIITVITFIGAFSLMLKKYAREYSLLINISMSILIIIYLTSSIIPIFNYIKSLISAANIPDKYVSLLFKSLGICFITQFASDSCRDAGESSLASKIEIVGKVSIVTASLPLLDEISQTTLALLGGK